MVAPRELGTHPRGHDQYFFASYATIDRSTCNRLVVNKILSQAMRTHPDNSLLITLKSVARCQQTCFILSVADLLHATC